MAIVNIDLSEYDLLRARKSELELRVKQLEEELKAAKDTTKVLVRTKTRNIFRSTSIFERDAVRKFTSDESESYVNFEDVRLKVEQHFEKEIQDAIKGYEDEAKRYREKYDNLFNEFKGKEKDLDIEHKREISDLEIKLKEMRSKRIEVKNSLNNIALELEGRFFVPRKQVEAIKDLIRTI